MVQDNDTGSKPLLFVAHSATLCRNAKKMAQRECGMDQVKDNMDFNVFFKEGSDVNPTVPSLLPDLERHFELDEGRFPLHKFVSYASFLQEFWPEIKTEILSGEENKGLSGRLVWTKISSIIKGSIDIFSQENSSEEGGPLSQKVYMNLGKNHERLEHARRELVYKAFEMYQKQKKATHRWDRADRVLRLVEHVIAAAQKEKPDCELAGQALRLYFSNHEEKRYVEKLYVDEVQDCTPMELLCLMIACGGIVQNLFLAGDTAQQVLAGVEFRFTEVRKVASFLNYNVPKPEELHVNFRYSNQIRKVAHSVFQKLLTAFPASADVVPDKSLDPGRVQPCYVKGREAVKELLAENKTCVVLHRNETGLEDLLSDHAYILVAESKGLEFASVIVLDFFSNSPRQKEWKRYVLDDKVHLTFINHVASDSI